ncbi:MAG: aspartate/glutamate racemase family protein [Alphaproteobacteria bacterium]|nr:aspartate/glutamate racemase family protein [Alphaproteobacteria bacterium]
MKTIGIIGGMSYESTVEYYKIINEEINKRAGGLHSAKMLIESYDFAEIEKLQTEGNWVKLAEILSDSAKKLEKAGADYIAIATNTMHLVADEVQKSVSIPLIHIGESAANYIKYKNIDTVALLGTIYTMTKPFYKDKLKEHGINVIVPNENQQHIINDIIFNELCVGIIKEESKQKLNSIIDDCISQGAKAIVLGCTELPNIIKEAKVEIVDTTKIHSLEIVKRILE